MNEDSPIRIAPARRFTFSLRTMFLIVTCVAFFSLGFHLAGPEGSRVVLGLLFSALFLRIWFWNSACRQFRDLMLLGLLGLTFMFSVPALVDTAHEAARRAQCNNNLQQIGLALKAYHNRYGEFPAAYSTDTKGTPLLSWRAAILPFLEQDALFQSLRLDQPSNGPNNRAAAQVAIMSYRCPADKQQPLTTTNYVAIVGPKTAWPGAKAVKLADIKNPSKTILLIEIPASGINWLEPRDVTVEQLKEGLGALIPSGGESPHSEGFNALFADGHVETLPANIDPETLAKLLEIDPMDKADK